MAGRADAVTDALPSAAPGWGPHRSAGLRRVVRGWCAFVIAASMAGTAWLMAVGLAGSAVAVVGTGVVTAVLWIVLRPRAQWRHLPWFALAYVGWATVSLLWSEWPGATGITLVLLLSTTAQALFVAASLSLTEIVAATSTALKWMLGLSIAFELWVALAWRGPILPGFVRPGPDFDGDPILFWSRDKLFTDERIQGIFGNANALAYLALLAIVVFGLQLVTRTANRVALIGWTALAVYCFWRGSSATAAMCAVAIGITLGAVLLMRRARDGRDRRRLYALFAASGIAIVTALIVLREELFELLGRSSDLSGREYIWRTVADRIFERPLVGWGYSVPWVPTDPFFDGWIIDRGVTVMQAHSTWFDVALQLGVVGVLFFAVALGAFTWRAWYHALGPLPAAGRPHRPRSRLLLLPALVASILIVQSITESAPLLNWGWFLVVMLAFMIKQSSPEIQGTPHLPRWRRRRVVDEERPS